MLGNLEIFAVLFMMVSLMNLLERKKPLKPLKAGLANQAGLFTTTIITIRILNACFSCIQQTCQLL